MSKIMGWVWNSKVHPIPTLAMWKLSWGMQDGMSVSAAAAPALPSCPCADLQGDPFVPVSHLPAPVIRCQLQFNMSHFVWSPSLPVVCTIALRCQNEMAQHGSASSVGATVLPAWIPSSVPAIVPSRCIALETVMNHAHSTCGFDLKRLVVVAGGLRTGILEELMGSPESGETNQKSESRETHLGIGSCSHYLGRSSH